MSRKCYVRLLEEVCDIIREMTYGSFEKRLLKRIHKLDDKERERIESELEKIEIGDEDKEVQ